MKSLWNFRNPSKIELANLYFFFKEIEEPKEQIHSKSQLWTPLLMQAQSHFCKCRAGFYLGDIPTSLRHLSLLLTLLSIRNLILLVPNYVLFLPQHRQKDRVPWTGEWTDCCPLNLAISFLALTEAAVCAQSCVLHSCPAKMWFFNRNNAVTKASHKTWICFLPHRNITV